MYEKLRQTGRTTRMLKEALLLAEKGKTVYVICALHSNCGLFSRQVARDLKDAVLSEDGRVVLKSGGRICFMAQHNPLWNWDAWRVMGVGADAEILVDHYAIESRYSKALEELHRFDAK